MLNATSAQVKGGPMSPCGGATVLLSLELRRYPSPGFSPLVGEMCMDDGFILGGFETMDTMHCYYASMLRQKLPI